MAFIEHDHMVKQVSSATPNPTLCSSILPRTTKRGANRFSPKVLGSADHVISELCIPIKHEELLSRDIRPCFPHLLNDPERTRIPGHVAVQNFPRPWLITKKQYKTPKVSVGTVKKSIAAMASRWFRRKVSQHLPISGLLGARRSQRETVGSETLKPSFSNSPWIRGVPQVGFSAAMRKISSRMCSSTGWRPPSRLARESHFQ